jgi:hypothetical protein
MRGGMARYYAASTAIVLVVAIVFSLYVKHRSDIDVASVQVAMSPRPLEAEHDAAPRIGGAYAATGAWVMSALPDCFVQTKEVTGPIAYVRASLPADAVRLRAGTRFAQRACIVTVRADDVLIVRGEDRFLVTAPAQLLRRGTALVLLRPRGASGEARFYDPPAS